MLPGKYFCLLQISYLLIFNVHYSISNDFENHPRQSVITENDFYDHDDGDLDDDQQHPDHRSSMISGQTKNGDQFSGQDESRCERITIPLCLDTPYNFTRMPNLFDHHDQQSAAVSIEEYNLLINQECSEHLKFFLCSIYAPMCTEAVDISVTSCRSVCLKVQSDCMPLFNKVSMSWPESLNCTKFPMAGRGTLCMDPDSTSSPSTESSPASGAASSFSAPGGHKLNVNFNVNDIQSAIKSLSANSAKNKVQKQKMNNDNDNAKGQTPLQAVSNSFEYCAKRILSGAKTGSSSTTKGESNIALFGECALSCDRDYMFDHASKKFSEKWMLVWSSICFVATLFTLLTFLLERDTRFRYPERPVIFLSLCYNFYAFGYLLRYILQGDSVKCQKSFNAYGHAGSIEPTLIVSSGMDNSYCVIVFTLLYYFSMASVIWWVVLSFAWYLSAVRQWGAESIANVSQYFHLIAWGLPALLSIAILVGRSLDASELTGLCFVGHHNAAALFGYLIIPLSIFLVIGIGFITTGLLAMRNIRKQMSLQQERTVDLIKFDKLMARIAIFSVTYGLPTAVVIGCYVYEYFYMQIWSTLLTNNGGLCPSSAPTNNNPGKFYQTLLDKNGGHDQQKQQQNFQLIKLLLNSNQPMELMEKFSGLLTANDHEKEDLTLDNCQQILQRHRPLLEIYMLKIFMSLIVGIATCTWVLSRKTFLTWKSTLCYCICMRFKNPAAKATVALIPQQQVTVRGQISCKPCELPLIDQKNFAATEMNVVEHQKNYTTSSEASSRQYDYRHYGKYRSGGGGPKKPAMSGVSADL